ncbi:MAG: 3-hydroxyacyl-CoA dehydrogenase NAD-binding domain-containing protein [Chitinophagales bacterium]
MQYFTVEKRDQIAIIWLDQTNSKVNKLSPDLIEACGAIIDDIEQDDTIGAAIMISKKKDFIAGADLDAVYAVKEVGDWMPIAQKGHEILNRMENSRKPIIAAIHGAAMGGGLEVALACHYRICTIDKSTIMAQPEVQVGLLPGGGGTQRLPELIGVSTALDMMLTGKKVYARKALKLGLVDMVVHPSKLLSAALKQAKEMVGKKISRKDKRSFSDKMLINNPLGRSVVFREARKKVMQQTAGNFPAPLRIIECVEIGARRGRAAGFEAEVKYFDELVAHPVTKRLIEIFFAMTDKKKNPMADLAKKVDTLGMLGAGFMGAGISQISANKGIKVLLKDISNENLAQAQRTIWKSLSKRVKRKSMSKVDSEIILGRISPQLTYHNFNQTDIIIEAVFESVALKQKVLAECEAQTSDDCIFASNTSALPISKIAAKAKRPTQVIGMHYFSPVPKMPLLEIVVTPETADWVTATCFQLGITQGKTCIVVKDRPGFYTTRILSPLMNEALLLLEEGGEIEQIDACARDLGFPVGPVTLIDEVGIDVAAHIMKGDLTAFFKARAEEVGMSFKMSNAPSKLAEAGYHGRKNKKGFYEYDRQGQRKKNSIDLDIYDYFGGEDNRQELNSKMIKERLMMVMVNEAVSCLQDETLQDPRDGDIGAVFGLGFPPFTGGPFRYLDSIGCDAALKTMEKLQANHGVRFTPNQMIVDYAQSGKRFY